MRVLKFGGTSVATSDNIKVIRSIVQEKLKTEPIIVVVSALGGMTNLLTKMGEAAAIGDPDYQNYLDDLKERHLTMCEDLLPRKVIDKTLEKVHSHINRLEDIARGIFWIKEMSNRTKDLLLSFGETLSSTIITDYLNATGISTRLAEPQHFILTDNKYGNASVKMNETSRKIRKEFKNFEGLAICPGFIASDEKGEITTLGRGGSDYSASIIAAALKVKFLEIWTDVNGLMTADPRYVKSAHTIERISYEDAMELSHFGAKVIYPPSIQPVMDKNIPFKIKNTFNPDHEGTTVHSNGKTKNGKVVKGLSCIHNIALINVKGSGMVGIPSIISRIFQSLSREQINIILITQASSEHSISIGIDDGDIDKAKATINLEFASELEDHRIDPFEIEDRLAIIALVGSRMRHQPGVSGKLFSTLGSNGINIKAIAQGSSERNISIAIDSNNIKKALNAIHESFFLSDTRRINLFIIGVGTVGSAFLQQIHTQEKFLKNSQSLRIRVAGLANSKKMVFDSDGLELNSWKKSLSGSRQSFDLDKFKEMVVQLNLRNSIFIDNTANETIASSYQYFLDHSISVVTPNKIACSSKYDVYRSLKTTAVKRGQQFLFETNVGAGLPVLSTLNDLVKSGDQIRKIEAVLSGSLNFIFNQYGQGLTFREVVEQAMTEGYTEPDPRIDLSGIDVKRKLLILIRESGGIMEIDDIKNESFIPKTVMNANSVENFLSSLTESEPAFEQLVKEANGKNARLKFVATYSNGKAAVGLKHISKEHPFYNLEGKDNIVLFYTDRYTEQPLVIKGAGAGAQVTASGIFADIMKIANR